MIDILPRLKSWDSGSSKDARRSGSYSLSPRVGCPHPDVEPKVEPDAFTRSEFDSGDQQFDYTTVMFRSQEHAFHPTLERVGFPGTLSRKSLRSMKGVERLQAIIRRLEQGKGGLGYLAAKDAATKLGMK